MKIIVSIAFLLLLVRLFLKRVDWAAIEENNRKYYNEDGDHVYYDRKLIRYKRKQKIKR